MIGEALSVVLPQIMKKVVLKPYLSKIGLAYVKSPFLLSSKDRITTLVLVILLLDGVGDNLLYDIAGKKNAVDVTVDSATTTVNTNKA